MDRVRDGLRSFLQIEPAMGRRISIRETLDYQGNAIKNRIWYRGDGNELSQLYQDIAEGDERYLFWASRSTSGLEMRKIHTGLPSVIVDTLAGIVATNLNDFQFKSDPVQELWNGIAEENRFKELLTRAVAETLVIGDGAFKVSLDSTITDKPLLEFWPGDRVEYTMRRGRVTEIVFCSEIQIGERRRKAELREYYGMGYVRYKLTQDGNQIPLNTVESLADLQDIEFGTDERKYMLAVPLRFFPSDRWEGRGQSVYDKKIECFDAFDEAWSQWMEALRLGRTKTYIPESLIPRDPKTGALRKPNPFDNQFISTEPDMGQNAQNRIQTESPPIYHDAYTATYSTALDQCLQGLISPSTLGVDVKKLDNADAQREKEKVTLYTRDKIVEPLQAALCRLAEVLLMAHFDSTGTALPDDITADVTFGDYANPSFESQVETVGKAAVQGIMSVEAAIDELYGDSRDEEWKQTEAARIKAQQGVLDRQEPGVNDDRFTVPGFGGGNP